MNANLIFEARRQALFAMRQALLQRRAFSPNDLGAYCMPI